jgi:prefoldin subunit 5
VKNYKSQYENVSAELEKLKGEMDNVDKKRAALTAVMGPANEEMLVELERDVDRIVRSP